MLPLLITTIFVLSPALGWWLGFTPLGLLAGAVVVPLAEALLGPRSLGRPVAAGWMQRLLMLLVLAQIPWAAWQAAQLPGWAAWGLALSMGYVSGGIGIVLAHELGHRRGRIDVGLSRLLLALVLWGPYRLEHNLGHHRWAATERDAASARADQSLPAFLPGYLYGVYRHGLQLGNRRGAVRNEALLLVLLGAAFGAALGLGWGARAVQFWLLQAVLAVLLVAAVDYVEHWGLRRALVDGRPARMTDAHTWDCANGVSDALLFQLPRHVHHHRAGEVPAGALQRTPAAAQMPTGYAGMVLLASVPPLWFAVMRPRLARHLAAGVPD
jgi:alkane 1-monooxygenase